MPPSNLTTCQDPTTQNPSREDPASEGQPAQFEIQNAADERSVNSDRLVSLCEEAWQTCQQYLADQQDPQQAFWTGQLSTSALSTATALSACVVMREKGHVTTEDLPRVNQLIEEATDWLVKHANPDGGFGDTDRSHSNIATTLLVLAALELAEESQEHPELFQHAWSYVEAQGKWDGLRKRYGKDKTFVVPILTNCAIAGFIPWSDIPSLPFEAACLPQDWYRLARMPVVSYAIPALVAMGQAKFQHSPPSNPVTRFVRRSAQEPTLKVLGKMQPESGGYLEAVPLTSFVLMSLASIDKGAHPVAQACLRFILDSRLEDGSLPIDTNLATWVTSLTTNAVARHDGRIALATQVARVDPGSTSTRDLITPRTVRWLLSCQHTVRHPFTGATPGGWGWTNLSGAVPDADDTPAALLALSHLDLHDPKHARLKHQALVAVAGGLRWLLQLQNGDGGWPTFCRGWGKLPFDRSGTDLTAHAIRALGSWLPRLEEIELVSGEAIPDRAQIQRSIERGFRFLKKRQRSDGSWLPLWFGNQDANEEENPVYGTGRVLLAYADSGELSRESAQLGIAYLRSHQNPDGGWGGGPSTAYEYPHRTPNQDNLSSELGEETKESSEIRSTIEESSIALEALLLCGGNPVTDQTIMRGLDWLGNVIAQGALDRAWPIGFYFAKLWYYEKLYPAIFSLSALGTALRACNETKHPSQG